MVKNMMADASINGKKYTNHSLRATGAAALFDAGVPEAIILATVQQKHWGCTNIIWNGSAFHQ